MRQQLVFVRQRLGDGGVSFCRSDPKQQLAQQPEGEVVGLVQRAGVGDDGSEKTRQDGAQAGQAEGAALWTREGKCKCYQGSLALSAVKFQHLSSIFEDTFSNFSSNTWWR